jgi:hypothetical protein
MPTLSIRLTVMMSPWRLTTQFSGRAQRPRRGQTRPTMIHGQLQCGVRQHPLRPFVGQLFSCATASRGGASSSFAQFAAADTGREGATPQNDDDKTRSPVAARDGDAPEHEKV